jgi:hypothetical protein
MLIIENIDNVQGPNVLYSRSILLGHCLHTPDMPDGLPTAGEITGNTFTITAGIPRCMPLLPLVTSFYTVINTDKNIT